MHVFISQLNEKRDLCIAADRTKYISGLDLVSLVESSWVFNTFRYEISFKKLYGQGIQLITFKEILILGQLRRLGVLSSKSGGLNSSKICSSRLVMSLIWNL